MEALGAEGGGWRRSTREKKSQSFLFIKKKSSGVLTLDVYACIGRAHSLRNLKYASRETTSRGGIESEENAHVDDSSAKKKKENTDTRRERGGGGEEGEVIILVCLCARVSLIVSESSRVDLRVRVHTKSCPTVHPFPVLSLVPRERMACVRTFVCIKVSAQLPPSAAQRRWKSLRGERGCVGGKVGGKQNSKEKKVVYIEEGKGGKRQL